jgi:hypothetical protein
MKFQKASAENKMMGARAVNPLLFDRLINSTSQHTDFGKCWEFTAGRNKLGYGVLRVNGPKKFAHRMIYMLFHPESNPIVVRHNCNNPSCINPAHLREGTQKDNAMDRKLSGREGDRKGIKNGRSKLTEQQVLDIRTSDKTGAELARIHGVSKTVACHIKNRKSWRHI